MAAIATEHPNSR